MVVQRIHDGSRENNANTTSRSGERGDDPDRAEHLLLGELVSNESEGEWEHAAADALNRARHDHDANGTGDRGQERAEREATNAITRSRSLPNMSPRRPMMGVKMAAESKYAVKTHVTVF